MYIASSASRTCTACRSASEYTATEPTPMRRKVRRMRQAISPLFATSTLRNISVPDENLQRRGVVSVAWVVELRAVGNQHDDVHGGLQFDIVSRTAQAVGKSQAPVGSHRNIHEEVDVVSQI